MNISTDGEEFMKKGGVRVQIRACNNRLLENKEYSDIDIDDSDTDLHYVATDDGSDTDAIDYDYPSWHLQPSTFSYPFDKSRLNQSS
ncbi:hypothetical protein AVEN_154175-1 [Araneus ventricosus]|uniref:Uncharacterized protein n=1 Tax=Araneus ventricosus TaxID=182803 RepID=A0A4Y2GJB3_ARAVE|nr:hypothetical protein AVEN_154175-1 [Araneus ventricosus]